MVGDFQERIAAAVGELPSAQRSAATRNLEGLSRHGKLESDALESLLLDRSASTEHRTMAAWLVGLVKEKALAPALEEAIRSEASLELTWEAAKALCSLGRGAALFRNLLLQARSPDTRKAAAFALGCLVDRNAVNDLCQCLLNQDEQPEVRGQAAESLAYLKDEAAFPSLQEAVNDSSPEVRYWVVFAFGHLQDQRAVPILERLVGEDRAVVEGWGSIAEEAKQALRELSGKGPGPSWSSFQTMTTDRRSTLLVVALALLGPVLVLGLEVLMLYSGVGGLARLVKGMDETPGNEVIVQRDHHDLIVPLGDDYLAGQAYIRGPAALIVVTLAYGLLGLQRKWWHYLLLALPMAIYVSWPSLIRFLTAMISYSVLVLVVAWVVASCRRWRARRWGRLGQQSPR